MDKSTVTLIVVGVVIAVLSLILAAICVTILIVINRRKKKRREGSFSESDTGDIEKDMKLAGKSRRPPYKRKLEDPMEKVAMSSHQILQKQSNMLKARRSPSSAPVPLKEHETKSMARSLDEETAIKQCVYKEGKHIDHPGCLINKPGSKDSIGSGRSASSGRNKFKKSKAVFTFLPPKAKMKSKISSEKSKLPRSK